MGFDNESVLNIHTLAGEYFCPVCRLLVYPNEALQSQCTHLYCKPCLSYIVGTTRACPYDGYLVTEADSKPLVESNKTLAETIGKITVHCLYHRSGCSWQGPLSECTDHCAECAFGNSPVVCNRCAVQIVHRQVQEHAQSCPGVQPQALSEGSQDAKVPGSSASVDQSQASTQAQPSQTTKSPIPGKDSNQQASATTQAQSAVQTAAPTAEQWYQQQQQYQQYYQQYPGYDQYQQNYLQYYPYQQQAVPQSQPLVQPQSQLQTQAQSHPQVQLPSTAYQPQFNPQRQTHSTQTNPPSHSQPISQAQLHQQLNPIPHQPPRALMPQHQPPHALMPQHQQSHSQIQAQTNSQINPQHPGFQPQLPAQGLPQTQGQHPLHPISQPHHSSAHAVTGYHSYPQPQSQHQMQPGGLQHRMHYSQGGPPQFPQQGPPSHTTQSHVPIQNALSSSLLPTPGQVPPVQRQPAYAHQRPVMQPVQPSMQQQQLPPYPGQAPGTVNNQMHQDAYMQQHVHVQSQLRPQGPYGHPQLLHNIPLQHGMQPHQVQNVGGRPVLPPYGVSTHPHPQSSNSQQHLTSEKQHSGPVARPLVEKQGDHIAGKGAEADTIAPKSEFDVASGLATNASGLKNVKIETNLKMEEGDSSSISDAKGVSQSLGDGSLLKNVKEEPKGSSDDKKDIGVDANDKEVMDESLMKTLPFPDGKHLEGQSTIADQGKQHLIPHGASTHQQVPMGSSLPAPPGSLHHMQLPGHLSTPLGPLGPHVQGHLHSQGDRPPYGHDSNMFPNQRLNYSDERRIDSLGQQSGNAMRMNGPPGADTSSAMGVWDDRYKPFPDERMNPFQQDASRWVVDRREFEDLNRFSRTSDFDTKSAKNFGGNFAPVEKGSHGPNHDSGLKLGGPASSKSFPHPPDNMMHPNDISERPIGFHNNAIGMQPDSVQPNPDFLGPGRRFDRRHRDGIPRRSPGRDYHSLRGFGPAPGADDIDSRELHRFGDTYHGGRFLDFPSHLRMNEFEGPAQDGYADRFRMGEHWGHHMRGRPGESIGFGAFPDSAGLRELSRKGNFVYPRLGEPGFRSNFSYKGFPNDGGHYTGEMESFDNFRKKPFSMGWCRICKVDCETVEGLDLHSQTREHQKMAMDMVLTIKQNAKKQKLTTSNQSPLDDAIKSRNAGSEGRGIKN